jgi:hypothetical protein
LLTHYLSSLVLLVGASALARGQVREVSPAQTTPVPSITGVPGVIGDGKADNHAPFQSAVTSAMRQGGLLSIPPGNYKIDTAVTCGDNVSWMLPQGVVLSGGAGISGDVDGSATRGNSGLSLFKCSANEGLENTLYVANAIGQTHSVENYQKNGLYVFTRQSDPSSYRLPNVPLITRDGVGAELRSTIAPGNMTGRVVAAHIYSATEPGSEGATSGMEIEMDNQGAWQPATGTSTSKIGLSFTAHGLHNLTAATMVVPAGGLGPGIWGDGHVVRSDAVAGKAFAVRTVTGPATWTDSFSVDAGGNGVFANLATTGSASFAKLASSDSPNFGIHNRMTTAKFSMIAGGNGALDADYAYAFGNAPSTKGTSGSLCLADGAFMAQGDAQSCRNVFRAIVMPTTTTRLTTDGAPPDASNVMMLPDHSAYELSCKLIVHAQSVQEAAEFHLEDALLTRGGSAKSTALVGGAWVKGPASAGAIGLTPTITADTTLGSPNISIVSNSGIWHALSRCDTTQVQ